jgi:CheY-like chemotaxis protein
MPLDFSKLAILVVDDNDFMRTLYRNVLTAFKFQDDQIWEASDGHTAIQQLSLIPIDMVICDINMKPMTGIEFTKFIRTSPNSPDVFLPIIICTGYADLVHVQSARDAGATEILRKPISSQTIYSRLQTVIESPRAFISSPGYAGPDRRRRDIPFDGPNRRASEVDVG